MAKKAAPEKANKYKSSEIVVESDSEGDDGAADAAKAFDDDRDIFGDEADAPDPMDADAGSDDEAVAAPAKRKSRRVVVDDDEDEDEDEDEDAAAASAPKEDSSGTANEDGVDTPMTDSDEA